MRPARILAITGLLVGAALVALWLAGGLAGIERWAAQQQRAVQNAMAGALRALRSGQPGATASLMGLCLAYGVAHAVGPGHGKVVIGAYGFGSRVPLARLAALSLAASLAQAGAAVLLVWGGIMLLDLGRQELTDLSEVALIQASTVLIALVGLWLAWRGWTVLRRAGRDAEHHRHHPHDHGEACGCGHAHGPTPEQLARTHSLRDGLLVVAGIAIRPCTGALFLLILTWRMGIFATGILGALAMGLGTAMVTVAVAGLSVWARHGSLALLPPTGPGAGLARWLPGAMQLGAGLLIAAIAMLVLV